MPTTCTAIVQPWVITATHVKHRTPACYNFTSCCSYKRQLYICIAKSSNKLIFIISSIVNFVICFYQIASYLIFFYICFFIYIIRLVVIILIFKTSIQPMWKQWVQVEIWGFICMTFDYLQYIIPHDLKWNLSAWDSESISYQQVQLYTQHMIWSLSALLLVYGS